VIGANIWRWLASGDAPDDHGAPAASAMKRHGTGMNAFCAV
jgi:hypothetical protein